jgi:hypothetical protein
LAEPIPEVAEDLSREHESQHHIDRNADGEGVERTRAISGRRHGGTTDELLQCGDRAHFVKITAHRVVACRQWTFHVAFANIWKGCLPENVIQFA